MNTIDALKALQKAGRSDGYNTTSIYIVGGFVRDLLRNKVNDDLDIVVAGLPVDYIKKFLKKYGNLKDIEISKSNNTITSKIILFKGEDGVEAQISLPRKGKLQEYDMNNKIKHDVKFRDFKLNALYLPISYKSKKEIIDMVGGRQDISNKIISSNGSASERIKESPIRMLRAISLASRTGYRIDHVLIQAIVKNANLIKHCPWEAIRAEFDKILLSKKPSRYIRLLYEVGLLQQFAPEIANCFGVKQDKKYHKYDVFTHIVLTCDKCPPDLVLRMAGLLHDIGKPATRKDDKKAKRVTFYKHEIVSTKLATKFLLRLKYDKDFISKVIHLVSLHMYHYTREWTDGATRKFIKRANITEEFLTEDTISNFPLFMLRSAERKGNGLKGEAVTDRQRDFEHKIIELYKKSSVIDLSKLDIDGNILMEEFNLKPGRHIGVILNLLLDKVLEDPMLNERDKLLGLSKEILNDETFKAIITL